MKPYTDHVSVACSECGAESLIAVEYDHGASYYGQTEQLYAAEVVKHGCQCETDAAVEEAAVRMVEA